ncbi:MAG: EcsC family protein [Gammaproteobacteria bacterium]|nr:EcsC family protein [Gammaproteobacteria bacterium]MBA3731273.1 EcsC family protein [Gammaproteobacteria bacterium]
MNLSNEDLENLRDARALLENPSLAARIANALGTPIERGLKLLPASASEIINHSTRVALEKALQLAVTSLDRRALRPPSNLFHKLVVAGTGAGGGAFGLAGLPVELPISTMVMLRSIADVARSEGELIATPAAKLACVEVFALGGRATSDDATETGYFAVRAALQQVLAEAAQHIAQKGVAHQGAPALVRVIAQIASRFGIVVSEKVAAQAIPVIGAAGGAFVNVLFIDHYQDIARGHFVIRRLERKYGGDLVKAAYERVDLAR